MSPLTLWFGQPLLAGDVYEHACYVDYRSREAGYVERFAGHIDWPEITQRFKASIRPIGRSSPADPCSRTDTVSSMKLEASIEDVSRAFQALGEPTRLRIFQALRACADEVEVDLDGDCRPLGSLSVGEVCCRLGGSPSTLSHHLKELRLAGLIVTEKRGRSIYCRVDQRAVDRLKNFLDQPADCELTTRAFASGAGAP